MLHLIKKKQVQHIYYSIYFEKMIKAMLLVIFDKIIKTTYMILLNIFQISWYKNKKIDLLSLRIQFFLQATL